MEKEIKKEKEGERAPRALQTTLRSRVKINSLGPSQHTPCSQRQPPGEPRLFTFPLPTHLRSGTACWRYCIHPLTHSLAQGSAATPLQRPRALSENGRDINGHNTSMSLCSVCVCVCRASLFSLSLCHTHTHTHLHCSGCAVSTCQH